ncbi:MAG TPA: hypothetical protein VFD92_28250 [Candidatus Binatia bacterium]|nr:hypothetical protein [Candidatus Binatia bacterium]
MRFASRERFLQYCVSKRRTYLRVLFERKNPRGFFELWKSELDFARSRFEIDGAPAGAAPALGWELRWLLVQDLHQVVRSVVPDFPPVPPTVLDTLPGAMHQVRIARSMLIAGEPGSGKEQLAILLHVLAGRPGALVRLTASELGSAGGTPTRQLMPERGSVFIGDFDAIDPAAQEELLAFLNGDARRRDLLFFVATSVEPRELTSRHGVRRDLLVRVSHTEVRVPALRTRPNDARTYAGDVLFDLVRVPPDRLPELRSEARSLAQTWAASVRGGLSPSYDPFSEALSYVMWREKAAIATPARSQAWCTRIADAEPAASAAELCARVAVAFDRQAEAADAPGDAAPALRREERPSAPEPRRSHGESAVPTSVSRDQLLRLYYQALIAEERGDLRRVATRAGRRVRSLQAELARLGVRVPRELTLPHSSGGF